MDVAYEQEGLDGPHLLYLVLVERPQNSLKLHSL